jgi:hypothetical protein
MTGNRHHNSHHNMKAIATNTIMITNVAVAIVSDLQE